MKTNPRIPCNVSFHVLLIKNLLIEPQVDTSQEKGIRNKIYDVEKSGLGGDKPKGYRLGKHQNATYNSLFISQLPSRFLTRSSSTVKAFATLASRANLRAIASKVFVRFRYEFGPGNHLTVHPPGRKTAIPDFLMPLLAE